MARYARPSTTSDTISLIGERLLGAAKREHAWTMVHGPWHQEWQALFTAKSWRVMEERKRERMHAGMPAHADGPGWLPPGERMTLEDARLLLADAKVDLPDDDSVVNIAHRRRREA